jgi:peptidoglycan/xylan/chitin deacetylase (PgdA/CDA1 family)
MNYAFRVFAAIYNYRVVDQASNEEARKFIYSAAPATSAVNSGAIRIPARYSPRRENERLSDLYKTRYAGEDFYLFHGLDPLMLQPDWLGEIFEWLSSSHEKSISQRDSVGRIPDSEMIFSRAGLPAWKPQAALQMAWLDHFSRNGASCEALPRPSSPIADAEHLMVCSHDVDFHFTNRATALQRLVKNFGISWLVYGSSKYFFSNSGMLLKLLAGKRVGDYLLPLCKLLEEHGCRSTFFVVPVRGHRRDPNYDVRELALLIKEAAKRGFPIEIHGSYTSLVENRTLEPEAQALHHVTGKRPLGSRQHWLRFDDSEVLFQAIEDAGLYFDSSMGFSSMIGFRNGACFAFPPYDFKRERPHNFLEIPLAIMDGGLAELSRATGASPQFLAERVLQESRMRGWGGISILWHNPLEALSVPEEINHVFWRCAENRQRSQDKWLSTDQFLSICLPRYQNAGLLSNLKIETLSL